METGGLERFFDHVTHAFKMLDLLIIEQLAWLVMHQIVRV